MNLHKTVTYYSSKYQFRETVQDLLGTKHLEQLHGMPGVPTEVVTMKTDNRSVWHDRVYNNLKGSKFMEVYNRFLREVCCPWFGPGPIVAQFQPTFRLHWPGNFGVPEYHVDTDYQHPDTETNFWIPVTEAWGTNTIWLESDPGRKDFHPERVHVGQMLVFKGSQLRHGNEINNTGITRISFDFRVIPKTSWVDPIVPMKGLTHGHERRIGDYYMEVHP